MAMVMALVMAMVVGYHYHHIREATWCSQGKA